MFYSELGDVHANTLFIVHIVLLGYRIVGTGIDAVIGCPSFIPLVIHVFQIEDIRIGESITLFTFLFLIPLNTLDTLIGISGLTIR